MSWEQDKLEINEAVGRLMRNLNYNNIVHRPTREGGVGKQQKHIKRPMNAFMVFAQAMRRKLSEERPSLHNAELSKFLGVMWKSLTEEQKLPFNKEAKKLRDQHKREYPDYKYQPRRRKPPPVTPMRPKREPSPDRDQIDFARMPELSPALLDGPPDGAELDQYLKPTSVPEYHELQPRYNAHGLTHQTPPPLYAPLPSHIHPPCADWQHYVNH
ncbi:transcription factor SOX-9 [Amyelois transitella]|uniref:transcription factor SOX-9 n=1 Tax=Amyelois transitella TaxID=680683 RepID=UPI0029905718|nr:transcription factor SOX-9 [Amyelois transitella]